MTAFKAVISGAAITGLIGVGLTAINIRPTKRDSKPALAASVPAPSCGTPNDGAKRVPQDWTSFAPPARGHSYVDATFGCTVVRLTDARADGVADHHYYATLTPMSADDSKVFVTDEHGGWHVTDLLGNVILPTQNMPKGNSGTLLWDASDGSAFYFARQNSLLKGTISGHNIKTSVVHVFDEYRIIVLPAKTDLSVDGQSFAMWGGKTTDTGPLDIFNYNMRTNVKKTPYVTSCSQIVSYVQGECVHGITQTADDDVIIDFANDGACKECGNRLWDGSTLTHVQDTTNHMDTGYDMNGTSVMVSMGNSSSLSGIRNPCRSGWGLDVRNLHDLKSATCLLDKQPSWHVGYRGSASQPWVAVSFFDGRKPSPEFFNRSPDFEAPSSRDWELYEGEIMLVRIDGGAVYRLAYARSRSAEGYWAQPRAANSRDGKYVIFDSNMAYADEGCPTGIDNCTDVYLIKVQ